jgi:hypothetical protein
MMNRKEYLWVHRATIFEKKKKKKRDHMEPQNNGPYLLG